MKTKIFMGTLILFTLLNILDKILTYFGMQRGFIELNVRTAYLFSQFGVLSTIILQILIVTGSLILFYKGIVKLSEKINYIHIIASIPTIFIIGKYANAVVSNAGYLL